MARKIGRKEHWVYLDDDFEEVPDPDDKNPDPAKRKKIRKPVLRVRQIPAGQQPAGGGSVFRVVPTPANLLCELGLSRLATDFRHDKPSLVMQSILCESIDAWRWVDDGAGGEMPFEGPKSVLTLESDEQQALLGYILDRAGGKKADSAAGNGSPHSEDSPSDRPASGAATAV